jgi:hypothetical protein
MVRDPELTKREMLALLLAGDTPRYDLICAWADWLPCELDTALDALEARGLARVLSEGSSKRVILTAAGRRLLKKEAKARDATSPALKKIRIKL